MNRKTKIRVVDTQALSAAENMALDEALLEAREENSIPDTIRFLSFDPHCALIGYFQTVESELRTSYCRQEGIDVNRRITGGGALYWGTKDVGWEIFASSESFSSKIKQMEDYYELFCSAASSGINKFGLNSSFRPRNDIEIDGRKISGSGGTSIKRCFMFQGTLLVDIDLEIMLRALRVPIEKLKYNEINSLKERVTWLTRELGYCPSRAEIIKNLLEGFSETLETGYYFDELCTREKELFRQKTPYFSGKKHINRIRGKNTVFSIKSLNKTELGTVKCSAVVDTAKKILKTVIFTGDFFIYPRRAIFDLESALKNTSMNRENTEKIIRDFYNSYPGAIEGISLENLALSVIKCIEKLEYKKHGIPLKYYNDIFIIETEGNKTAKLKTGKRIEAFLLPYCAKLPDCSFRSCQGCDVCGKCSVGEISELLDNEGIRSTTITNYEHLEDTLQDLKDSGVQFFCGCCCEAFYIKHKKDFERIGLSGILINIDNSTCYDLGREKEAYSGNFEGFTELKIPLIKKILKIYNHDNLTFSHSSAGSHNLKDAKM
ncbi:MAG: lipoyl protein ligase domain-containing protein [Chitinophagaceae bacterium]